MSWLVLTNQLKLTASDGKKYPTDTLDSGGVIYEGDYIHITMKKMNDLLSP